MKLHYNIFNRTALHLAIAKGNPEMVNLLLANRKIDVNIKSISFIFISF